jgi:hypothetical protein
MVIFQNHDEFKGMKALITFLQFIPMEDEILDFFRPVSTHILKQFRAKPCMPTQPNSKGTYALHALFYRVLTNLNPLLITCQPMLKLPVFMPTHLPKVCDK